MSADTKGAKVLWDVVFMPLVKPLVAPQETCMALVRTGKKMRRRISECFSPVSYSRSRSASFSDRSRDD